MQDFTSRDTAREGDGGEKLWNTGLMQREGGHRAEETSAPAEYDTTSTMPAKEKQNSHSHRAETAAAFQGNAQSDPRASKASDDKPFSSDSSEGDNQVDEEKGLGKPDDTPAKADDKEELSPGRSKGKIALIMLALCMAVFLAALDVTIITTALPTISEHFDSTAGYTWIGSAFLLANAASIPSWGKVSDIFGRKPMLLVANVIFMVGSLVAALANSIGMLIAARAVQGIGGGGLIILVNIVIGDLFSMRNRAAFYGLIGGVWAIASSIGPIIGGAFTQAVSWRW